MKIVTDSAADMPAEEAAELGVGVAPLYIQFPEGEVNSNEISPDEFYQRLVAMQPDIPSTAQPSEANFKQLYEKNTQPGDEVISVHISTGLSGTINAARLASEQLPDRTFHLVDTLTLSGGERFQVLAAAWAARKGWSAEAILHRLDEIRACTEIIYTLETLKYLARGGRIGRVQALAGSLLKIKPIIRVAHEDGKYSTAGKARTINRALEEIGDHLADMYAQERMWVTILHGNFKEPADELSRILKNRLTVGHMEVLRVSPVLGVHTGPGVVGAGMLPMRLLEDLL